MKRSDPTYSRQYRQARPEVGERNNALGRAKARALHRLADNHAEEFRRLYEGECVAAGIEPPRRYAAVDSASSVPSEQV